MGKDAIVEKLRREMIEPITTERQVVYILVEVRKLMERDAVKIKKRIKRRELPNFNGLRFFCNWALHADMTDGPVKNDLSFLGHIVEVMRAGRNLTAKETERTQRLLSFGDARPEFLAVVRYAGLNRAVPHLFSSSWWAAFLRQYVGVIQDCPLVLETAGPAGVKQASVAGHEILEGLQEEREVESIFRINWRFELKGGEEFPLQQDLAIERTIPNLFGRHGRIARGTKVVTERG